MKLEGDEQELLWREAREAGADAVGGHIHKHPFRQLFFFLETSEGEKKEHRNYFSTITSGY